MTASKQFNKVHDALKTARQRLSSVSNSARLDAEVLLASAFGKERAWLYANPETRLDDRTATVFQAMLGQRAEGRPVAHLTGVREFWSLELSVNEYTLVPRPETELLVETALKYIVPDEPTSVLDLGTGSGAIAIAIASERPACSLTAVEQNASALAIARENAQKHTPDRITFLQGNWFSALPAGSSPFDVIASNPPYVGENESELMDPELAFEPADALYSGKDGLSDIRQIITDASIWLKPGGWLLLEHGFRQHGAVMQLLSAAGFESIDNIRDFAGQPRVSYGQKRQ